MEWSQYVKESITGTLPSVTSKAVVWAMVLMLVTTGVTASSHEWNYTGTSYNVETGTSPYGGVEHNGEIYITNQSHVIVYDTAYNRQNVFDISGTTTGARDLHWNGSHWLVLEDPAKVHVFSDTFSYTGQTYNLTYSDGSDIYRTRGMVEKEGSYYITGYDFNGKRDIEEFDSQFNHVGTLTNNITSETTGMQGVGYDSGDWYILSGDDNAVYKYDSNGAYTGDSFDLSGESGAKSGMFIQDNEWHVPSSNDDSIHLYGTKTPRYSISGEVTDSNNEELSNANITVKNQSGATVATDTTDHLGKYSVEVENGTYNVTASKTDYTEETKEVTVNGSGETANFKIKKFNQSIQLDVRMYMEHGQVSPYEVVVSVDGDRRDVTGEANVTSGDTNVVTIDSAAHEVIATNNTSINRRTYVRAEWTDSDGNTYTTERNVTVANATVENIQILPTFTRFSASISDETLMVIIIATGFGAAASLFSTSFAGIAAMTMLMLLGWLAGYVHNGMAIVTVLSAMFIGMNVAGNVDYTVRR